MAKRQTRREARQVAFELLFEWSFTGDPIDEIIENAVMAREIVVDSFARELVCKVVEYSGELDSLIGQYSQGWKLQRISKTALTVLRMSFCEITRFGDIPVGVSINEAVELAKKFGTDEESAYLNGILGNFEKVRKGLREAPSMPKRKEEETVEYIEINEHEEHNAHNKQIGHGIEGRENNGQERGEPELIDDIVIEVE